NFLRAHGGEAGGLTLDGLAELVEVADLLGRVPAHPGALPAAAGLQHPLCDQPSDRLADGDAADAELLRQPAFDEPFAGPNVAGEDLLHDLALDGVNVGRAGHGSAP